jgi:hypothetical protein
VDRKIILGLSADRHVHVLAKGFYSGNGVPLAAVPNLVTWLKVDDPLGRPDELHGRVAVVVEPDDERAAAGWRRLELDPDGTNQSHDAHDAIAGVVGQVRVAPPKWPKQKGATVTSGFLPTMAPKSMATALSARVGTPQHESFHQLAATFGL